MILPYVWRRIRKETTANFNASKNSTRTFANYTDSEVESKGPIFRKRHAKYETQNGNQVTSQI